MDYTKGEWEVTTNDSGLLHIETKGTHIYIGCILDDDRGKANAHLIAAAPDMYEALSFFINQLEPWIKLCPELKQWTEFAKDAGLKALTKAGGK